MEYQEIKDLLLEFVNWYFEPYHPSIDFPTDEDVDYFMELISKES